MIFLIGDTIVKTNKRSQQLGAPKRDQLFFSPVIKGETGKQKAIDPMKRFRPRGALALTLLGYFAASLHAQQSTGALQDEIIETSKQGDTAMIKGIDNIGICVADLERSVAFYEKLGFTRAFTNDRGITMVAGLSKLFVFQTRQSNAAPVSREFTLFENPPGIDHISFDVEDVDGVYASAKAKGIVFNGEPRDQDWGARVVGLRDPDGNNLYLLKWLKK
jgi:methylmalonyl-CoA/ethylmalonyl-CoA epimerase